MPQELTADLAREYLSYDPLTGAFRWLKRAGKRSAPGCIAGRRLQVNNSSGMLGVSWEARKSKRRAGIRAGKRAFNLGLYDTKEDAAQAYLAAKAQMHPFQPAPRQASA